MLYLLKFVSISSQQPSTQPSEARGGAQPRPRLPSRLIQHTQFFFCWITGDSKELFRLDRTLSGSRAASFSQQPSIKSSSMVAFTLIQNTHISFLV